MNLLEECIEILGKNAKILDEKTAENILCEFDKNFPLTAWGRIDWNKIKKNKKVNLFEEIIPSIKEEKRRTSNLIYVIGSDPTIPIFESKLDTILENFYDVAALSPNTWLYCPKDGWVIEFYHDGETTIGFV